jgi:hypothetical protein
MKQIKLICLLMAFLMTMAVLYQEFYCEVGAKPIGMFLVICFLIIAVGGEKGEGGYIIGVDPAFNPPPTPPKKGPEGPVMPGKLEINCKFIIGVNTYDKDIFAYSLIGVVNGVFEVINSKVLKDKEQFMDEVKNMSKYFNAKIVGDL